MTHWRINLILLVILLFGTALGARLFFLQILQHDFYSALARGQQKIFSPVQGERGEVFFNNGEILATNVKKKYLYISPKEIKDKEKTAQVLSDILALDKDWLLEKIKKDSFFEVIKNRLSEEEAASLAEMESAGLYLSEEVWRDYPHKSLAGQTIGFVGGGGFGQYGLEERWNDVLAGKEGTREAEKAPGGYFSFLSENEVQKGADLILTLNYNIQYFSEKLLREAYEDLNIRSGSIIVIEPVSGRVLALANFPSFDPNRYFEETNFRVFINGAVQELFEPGSIFKPITMAAGLNEGKITPQTTYTDPGIIKIGGQDIKNYGQRTYPGEISMTEVLEKSINTGAVFVETQIDHKIFLDYIERLGIFEKTGIDLPGEISSFNEELKKGYEINFATASFGQGIALTPIQLVRTFCAIANGGKMVRPYVVEKIIEDGKIIEVQPEIGPENIISPTTASRLTAMLVSVVENGFAKKAQVAGYYIAGKTGTAEVPWSALGEDRQGYSSQTIQSFIGFAPAFKPEFLILIKLDNPATDTAEYSAVPVFQKLAEYIIDYEQIPPEREETADNSLISTLIKR